MVELGLISAILNIVEKLCRWVMAIWRRLRGQTTTEGGTEAVPSRTVTIVQESRVNALYWSPASMGTRPFVSVVADLNVTNIWRKEIRLAGALIRYPQSRWRRITVRGDTMVRNEKTGYSGNHPIPPNTMSHVRAHFLVPVKVKREAGHFKADIALIDQFGNHHWCQELEFRDSSNPI